MTSRMTAAPSRGAANATLMSIPASKSDDMRRRKPPSVGAGRSRRATTREGPPLPRKPRAASMAKRTPNVEVRPSTSGELIVSEPPRSCSASPPAEAAAHMGIAAATATGKPARTSPRSMRGHGVTSADGESGAVGAEYMHNANISPIATRTGVGSARRPNAGTSTTVGSTLAQCAASSQSVGRCRARRSLSSVMWARHRTALCTVDEARVVGARFVSWRSI